MISISSGWPGCCPRASSADVSAPHVPSVLLFVFYAMSFTLMTIAVKKIDMSVSYAIWSGVGTALIAIIGIGFFKEPITALKVVSLLLIVVGVFGLNAGTRTE